MIYLDLKICDRIILNQGLHTNPEFSFFDLKRRINKKIIEFKDENIESLLKTISKYRNIGQYIK